MVEPVAMMKCLAVKVPADLTACCPNAGVRPSSAAATSELVVSLEFRGTFRTKIRPFPPISPLGNTPVRRRICAGHRFPPPHLGGYGLSRASLDRPCGLTRTVESPLRL